METSSTSLTVTVLRGTRIGFRGLYTLYGELDWRNGETDFLATKLSFYLKFVLTIQRFTAVAEENMRNFLLMTNMMFALISMSEELSKDQKLQRYTQPIKSLLYLHKTQIICTVMFLCINPTIIQTF